MDLQSHEVETNRPKAVRLLPAVSCFLAVLLGGIAAAKEGRAVSESRTGALPRSVNENDFAPVLTHPPFRRSLALSDSVILTGVARIQDNVFATLIDTETAETRLVTSKANAEGWQLVDVTGDESDLESLTAKIQVSGGEVISVRYESDAVAEMRKKKLSIAANKKKAQLNPDQINEAKRSAVKYKEGFSSDGYPKEPPPEVVRKLSRLSVDQRERVNRYMIGLRNQGLGMDERREIYNKTLDRALQSRR